ncbi:MAG: hypothetical protein M1820_008645 [Bogoriella megaspora]|nr:MAG: hypothetical protein M1820_008645 [Bogoriella megaspora]
MADIIRIWYNWKRKSTEGLPGLMVFLWGFGTTSPTPLSLQRIIANSSIAAVPSGIYNVVQRFNIPLQIQPQCMALLCLVCWGQTLYWGSKFRVWTAILTTMIMILAFGGLELLIILVARPPYDRGIDWPMTFIGVCAACLYGAGLAPPYFEARKRKGRQIGINFWFLFIDMMGGVFSLLALVAQQHYDILGGTQYIVVIFLELGIFASHYYWMFCTRQVRKEAKFVGLTYDEYVENGEPKVLIMAAERGLLYSRAFNLFSRGAVTEKVPTLIGTAPVLPTITCVSPIVMDEKTGSLTQVVDLEKGPTVSEAKQDNDGD